MRKYIIIFTYNICGGEMVSPRAGRPTHDPKNTRMELRLSESDVKKLNFCCETLHMTKAEVIREGIDKVYKTAKK